MTPTKLGFILSSNSQSPVPSTRIAILNMLPYLRAANFDPHIVFEPVSAAEEPGVAGLANRMFGEGFEIAYFQKVRGASVVAEARALSRLGIKTIYGVCDLIDNEMAEATDATIVVTPYLKSLYAQHLQHKIHVVHDGIENANVCKMTYDKHRGAIGRPLRAVLVTSKELDEIPILRNPPRFLDVTVIGPYPETRSLLNRTKKAYWRLVSKNPSLNRRFRLPSMFGGNFKAVNWDLTTVFELMAQADIGIIPVNTNHDPVPGHPDVSSWQVKSENRLTMKMSIGLPVIATPVPSYRDVVVQGMNGFLAGSRQEWLQNLEQLRDPEQRRAIGEAARRSVMIQYSKDAQAAKLIAALKELGSSRKDPG